MEWQAIVLGAQILLLAVGYFLFQQARGELSARAAETPVLSEIKALQRSVKQLLLGIEETTDSMSERLETQCAEARKLLAALDARLAEWQETLPPREIDPPTLHQHASSPVPERDIVLYTAPVASASPPPQESSLSASSGNQAVVRQPNRDTRREKVFELADAGVASIQIARETGLSEGEVETLLSLRLQRR